jgi:hypothetical protein
MNDVMTAEIVEPKPHYAGKSIDVDAFFANQAARFA